MRIIAGTAGRRAIQVPPCVTRPTTDMVRQAVFSIIGSSIQGARVLDVFAGSGALGLEALSRGAASCIMVEQDRQAAAVIRRNLSTCGLAGGSVVQAEVSAFLKRNTTSYDWIFADPPYCKKPGDRDHVKWLLQGGLPQDCLAMDGHLMIELSAQQATPDAPGLELLTRREYGGTAVLIFQRNTAALCSLPASESGLQ